MTIAAASSVEDEDARMGACLCGGRWRVASERVIPFAGHWYDSIVAACPACQRKAAFLYDITSFFDARPRVWADYGRPRDG